jgi:hypothetical protein
MSKQTAVEWLEWQINLGLSERGLISAFKEAKQTEKEQHEETWFRSRVEDMGDEFKVEQKSFDDYYNETYGQTKN